MKHTIQRVILGLLLLIPGLLCAAKPVFLITPVIKAPATIYAGQTASASYLVTNNTPFPLKSNGLIHLPPGLTQTANGCSNPFDLESGQSCTLNLLITADTLQGNLIGGPVVCNTRDNPIYCSRPSVGNELNVIKNNNSQAPVLSITAPTQGLRYVDLDTSTALSLTISNAAGTLPTALSASVPVAQCSSASGCSWTNATVNTDDCQNLQPGGTCTLTVNTTSANVPGQLTITGTNGANTLTTWVASFKNNGLVFYVNTTTNIVKVAQTADISEGTLWQSGDNSTAITDVNDGCANTQSILSNIGTTDNAAALCTTNTAANCIPSSPKDITGWYLPAICEMGYNLTGGPTGCNADNQYNDLTSLYIFYSESFSATIGYYWSSSENQPGYNTWAQSFSSSDQIPIYREDPTPFGVRCVQAFIP